MAGSSSRRDTTPRRRAAAPGAAAGAAAPRQRGCDPGGVPVALADQHLHHDDVQLPHVPQLEAQRLLGLSTLGHAVGLVRLLRVLDDRVRRVAELQAELPQRARLLGFAGCCGGEGRTSSTKDSLSLPFCEGVRLWCPGNEVSMGISMASQALVNSGAPPQSTYLI